MKGRTKQPKVFISYSWSSPQHEQWALDLAERLSGDGVVVVLDKWDLKEGQDEHVFMEQMVNDADITSVYNFRGGAVELFDKMVSLQHFEKIKGLFDVQNTEQLNKLVAEYVERNKDQQRRYSGLWDYDIRPLENVIDSTKIGTVK